MSPEELYNHPMQKQGFNELFQLMRTRAIVTLTYRFEGSGDSGNLESEAEWSGLHEDAIELKNIPCNITIQEPNGKRMVNGGWVQEYDEKHPANIEELGFLMAMVVLNNDPNDWYNNDGGFGSIVFSVTPEGKNKIFCDMNTREVISHASPDEIEFDHAENTNV